MKCVLFETAILPLLSLDGKVVSHSEVLTSPEAFEALLKRIFGPAMRHEKIALTGGLIICTLSLSIMMDKFGGLLA